MLSVLPFTDYERDAAAAYQIIMLAGFGIESNVAALACVALEAGDLLLQKREGLEIRRIIESVMLHQAQEVANNQGFTDIVISRYRVAARCFPARKDDWIKLLASGAGGVKYLRLLQIVPDRCAQA